MVDQLNPLSSLVARAPTISLAANEFTPAKYRPPTAKIAKPQLDKPGSQLVEPSPDEIREAVEHVKDFLKKSGNRLELQEESQPTATAYSDLAFQVDKDTGILFFKIIDAGTRKVIRQVPSEEVMAMARKLRELSGQSNVSGVLIKEEG